MTAPIAGTSAQASMRYARAARDAASEALRADASPAKARVRTRSFGVKLGGFGLTYTSEDVQLDTASSAKTGSAGSLRGGFGQSLETASLRSEMVRDAANQTLSNLPAQRRVGLRAYQDALAPATGNASRSLLGVA